MNLVVANLVDGVTNLTADQVLTTSEILLDRRLADLSMKLDELMFIGLKKVDVVYVRRDHGPVTDSDINLADLETAYFLNSPAGSFYCSPEIFSILGKMYKLNFAELHFTHTEENSEELLTEKILFLLTRLGYKINAR